MLHKGSKHESRSLYDTCTGQLHRRFEVLCGAIFNGEVEAIKKALGRLQQYAEDMQKKPTYGIPLPSMSDADGIMEAVQRVLDNEGEMDCGSRN